MTPSEFGAHRLRLIGGGGHAAVVVESARASSWIVKGLYDDNPGASPDPLIPYLGTFDDIAPRPDGQASFIIAIGDLPRRRQLIEELERKNIDQFAIVGDRSCRVSVSASIGDGVFIAPQAAINARAVIDAHAIINTGAIVEHDCVIASNVHIGPGAVLGGRVHVGAHTLVGIGAVVKPGIHIGSRCTIAAGAVVVDNVPDDATVKGVPAR